MYGIGYTCASEVNATLLDSLDVAATIIQADGLNRSERERLAREVDNIFS